MFVSYQQLDNIGQDFNDGLSPADLIQKHCITQAYIDKLRAEIGPKNPRYWIVVELGKFYTVAPFLNKCNVPVVIESEGTS